MRRKNYIIYSLLFSSLFPLPGHAGVKLPTSDLVRLNSISQTASGEGSVLTRSDSKVEMLIRYDNEETLADMEKAGAEILSLVGLHGVIVAASPDRLQQIADCRGVTGARLSGKLRRGNNNAILSSGVNTVHEGLNLPQGYDGKGVVLGMYDVGIDPNHIHFQDNNGKTKIKRFLHYKNASSVPAILSTTTQISNFTSDDPGETHGTHVLGIMAGGFHDTSVSGAPDYRGVAPGAELIVGAGAGYNTQILDAVERIGKYAIEQGKPCVVNLSFGDNIGPHDGSDAFTKTLNEIAEKYNIALCLAAGNEADLPISIVKTLAKDDSQLQTLVAKISYDQGASFLAQGPVEVWSPDSTPFDVYLDLLDANDSGKVLYTLQVPVGKETYLTSGNRLQQTVGSTSNMHLISSGTPFQTLFNNSYMGGVAGIDSENGCYSARLNFYLAGKSVSTIHTKYVRIRVTGKEGQRIYLYTDGYDLGFGTAEDLNGIDVPDGFGSNSNMASGSDTFAVGSYVTKNIAGSGYPSQNIGEISFFSSYGETLDGRVMPDVVAPGQVIVSARNGEMPTTAEYNYYYPVEYTYTDKNSGGSYHWTSMAGTSQASPHMAGVMALMRSANPSLSNQEVYSLARESAVKPGESSEKWGYGRLDALAAIKAVLKESSIDDLVETGVESILVNVNSEGIEIITAGEEGMSVSLYDLAGICHFNADIPGNELRLPVAGYQPGVYLLNVRNGKETKRMKIRI